MTDQSIDRSVCQLINQYAVLFQRFTYKRNVRVISKLIYLIEQQVIKASVDTFSINIF